MNKQFRMTIPALTVIMLLILAIRWTMTLPAASLEQLNKSAELILKVLIAIVGAAWAIYKYVIGGTSSWMNNISLETEVLPYRGNLCLLVIHVRSTNPRATKFEFDDKNATYTLDIRTLADDRTDRTVFAEEAGQHVVSVDLLEGSEGFEMLPSATVDDMRSIVLPRGTIASVTAELRIKRKWRMGDDFISASAIIRIEPDGTKAEARKEDDS
jgi:hypothetical protein